MLNIVILGLVSLFIDMSSEMVYPLIPLYLTAALGATPAIIGVIEGFAESAASLLKVFSGYFSDRWRSKKPFVLAGYSASALYKLLLLVSSTWPGVLAARLFDRFGKGVRTAPRDALIAESSPDRKLGGSFGLHKMLDMAGSAIGVILAYLLLNGSATNFKAVFAWSIVPAVIGILLIPFIRERKREAAVQKAALPDLRMSRLDGRLKAFLVIIFFFTLGNSSNAFLLLRAQDSGFDEKTVILLYLAYNVVASLLAWPLGRLSDRIGRKALLVAGYAFFGFVYLGFAVTGTKAGVAALFVVYGVYTAMTAGVERAFVSEIAPEGLRGTMLGLHATLTGIALLPASVVAGLLWTSFGMAAPFYYGAALALAASVAVLLLIRTKPAAPAA